MENTEYQLFDTLLYRGIVGGARIQRSQQKIFRVKRRYPKHIETSARRRYFFRYDTYRPQVQIDRHSSTVCSVLRPYARYGIIIIILFYHQCKAPSVSSPSCTVRPRRTGELLVFVMFFLSFLGLNKSGY